MLPALVLAAVVLGVLFAVPVVLWWLFGVRELHKPPEARRKREGGIQNAG